MNNIWRSRNPEACGCPDGRVQEAAALEKGAGLDAKALCAAASLRWLITSKPVAMATGELVGWGKEAERRNRNI